MNSIYEVHAFMIGFIVAFIGFFMLALIFIWKEKDKRQEIALSIVVLIIIIFMLMAIPDWVMENNFYKEPHYALAGIFGGFISGLVMPLMLYKHDFFMLLKRKLRGL